jgi:hypothetical protein
VKKNENMHKKKRRNEISSHESSWLNFKNIYILTIKIHSINPKLFYLGHDGVINNGNIVSFKVKAFWKIKMFFLEWTFILVFETWCLFFLFFSFSLHDIVSVGYHEKKKKKKRIM